MMHCEAMVEDNKEESGPCINMHEYDEKGRCVRHPYVQLRKKNIFGRKWKVMLSACPDCCIDEFKRIRLVEESRRKKRSRAPSAVVSNGPQPPSLQEHHPFPIDRRSQGSSRQLLNVDNSHRRSSLSNGPPGQRRSSSKVRTQNSIGSSSVNSSSYSSFLRESKTPMALTPPQPRGPIKGNANSDMDTASLTELCSDSSNNSRVSLSFGRNNQVVPYTG